MKRNSCTLVSLTNTASALQVIDEVTKDPKYSMFNLAKKKTRSSSRWVQVQVRGQDHAVCAWCANLEDTKRTPPSISLTSLHSLHLPPHTHTPRHARSDKYHDLRWEGK